MVGTPAAALHVECGQPPLALRRQRMMADYALKVKSVPDHPTASTLEDCWQSHYANYPAGLELSQISPTLYRDTVVRLRLSSRYDVELMLDLCVQNVSV